jgi:hypothetical protein
MVRETHTHTRIEDEGVRTLKGKEILLINVHLLRH